MELICNFSKLLFKSNVLLHGSSPWAHNKYKFSMRQVIVLCAPLLLSITCELNCFFFSSFYHNVVY